MALSREQKRAYALQLYLQDNLSQEEICELVEWTPKTFYNNKVKGKWEEMLKMKASAKEQTIVNLWNRIYELSSAKDSAKTNAKEIAMLSKAIERHTSASENISQVIENFKNFINWLKLIDLEFSQKVNKYQKDYVGELLTKYKL
jgi:predicted DNA-binding protein YlxM (UPF0122 family)